MNIKGIKKLGIEEGDDSVQGRVHIRGGLGLRFINLRGDSEYIEN